MNATRIRFWEINVVATGQKVQEEYKRKKNWERFLRHDDATRWNGVSAFTFPFPFLPAQFFPLYFFFFFVSVAARFFGGKKNMIWEKSLASDFTDDASECLWTTRWCWKVEQQRCRELPSEYIPRRKISEPKASRCYVNPFLP